MHDTGPLSPPMTASTKNFRESTHLIPTIAQDQRPKPYNPPQMRLWVIIPAAAFMIALGIALEVALAISNRNDGFSVPEKNVFKFASQQFLTSFVPVVFVAPLALLWDAKTWLVKRYQPYVNLARGDASAEDSLLLDYISVNSVYCLWQAFKKRHWLVFIATLGSLITLILQPLAGSIFDVKQLPEVSTSAVISNRTLGLDPNRFQLTSFLAAAGYALAAVSDHLLDPPFIHNNWAAADFQFPDVGYLNGTISVNTTGIRTNATCTAPTRLTLDSTTAPPMFTLSGTSAAGCSASVAFNSSDSNQQYGVNAVQNCGSASGVNQTFLPVFFWFFTMNDLHSESQGAGVFCSPTLEVFSITANASLNDGSLGNVSIISPIVGPGNNVTGSPQNGLPFNGVVFDASPDRFVATRANATNNGVPGAIMQAVQRNASVLPNAFNSLDGFVDTTSRVYTQHLALIAKNTYFLTSTDSLPAIVSSLRPRLVIEPLASHALAVVLIVIGILMMIVGIAHHRIRKEVFLASPPGSIASAVALTSHSGFGMFLVPYDTELDIAVKLEPLYFSLDRRTGSIVACDRPNFGYSRDDPDASDAGVHEKLSEQGPKRGVRSNSSLQSSAHEETLMSLLGRDQPGYLVEPFTPPP